MVQTLIAQSRMTPKCTYLLPVHVSVTHPQTVRQVSLRLEECKVDTGFNGDILVPFHHASEMSLIGVRLYDGNFQLANGNIVPGKWCRARVTKISDCEFPAPDIEIALTCCGEPEIPLFGLRLLSKWIAKFHGPKRLLTIFKES